MTKVKPTSQFDQILSDLESILAEVKQSDTQLEQSLDLFEDALAKATQAAELSDAVDFSELDLADESDNGAEQAD